MTHMNMVVPERRAPGGRRAYEMRGRAVLAAETRVRILEAALAFYYAPGEGAESLTVATVARNAEVTTQTILRLFQDRDGLIRSALDLLRDKVVVSVPQVDPADPAASVPEIVELLELHGNAIVRLYHDACSSAAILEEVQAIRLAHAQWCDSAFGPALAHLDEAERAARVILITALLDTWSWYRLRVEQGLSRERTVQIMAAGITTAVAGS